MAARKPKPAASTTFRTEPILASECQGEILDILIKHFSKASLAQYAAAEKIYGNDTSSTEFSQQRANAINAALDLQSGTLSEAEFQHLIRDTDLTVPREKRIKRELTALIERKLAEK